METYFLQCEEHERVINKSKRFLSLCSHDQMAKYLGVPALPFEAMYPEKANEIKRMVLEYIKVLRNAHVNNSQASSEERFNGLKSGTLEIDESGFPLAPRPQSWKKVTKVELEPLYRMYITRQYRRLFSMARPKYDERLTVVLELACQDDERQAPFEKITQNPSDFLDADYLPTGISIKDPRSMRLESIVTFFKHVLLREASHGVPNAFRFKAVLSGRKKGVFGSAHYKDEEGNLEEHDIRIPPPKLRRKRRKPKPANVNEDRILDEDIPLPAATDGTDIPSATAGTDTPCVLPTPDPTPSPNRNGSLSPGLRKRGKSRLLHPESAAHQTAEGSSSIGARKSPRRSPRTSVQSIPPNDGNDKPKKKKKKTTKKRR